MDLILDHILSLVIFFPAVGALFLLLFPKSEQKLVFNVAIIISLVELFLSLILLWQFNNTGSYEFIEIKDWISAWNIHYFVGIDGVSLLLILLSTILTPIVLIFSAGSIKEKAKSYVVSMLFLEVGMIGVFAALDLFLFYLFWEAMLVPMYLIVGIWGGKERIYAAVKFFIYTMAGSLLMLVAILYLYFQAGGSFNLIELYEQDLAFYPQLWVFTAFALAFAIKVPIFPLHTWLPDAHVQAPTAGSVILAGVLLKMGTYGFFRFAMPLFPEAFKYSQYLLMFLCVVGIVYGALVALVQTDIKKLIAYSSVSHLGVVMLGVFSLNETGMVGGLFQMLSHGVSTGALFLMIGMLYDRTHTREIKAYGGLGKQIPKFTVLFIIVTLSSIGLPLTNGFVGEFLSLIGAFQTNKVLAIVGTSSVVLGAVYMLWVVERVFFGRLKTPEGKPIQDLTLREMLLLVPFIVAILWMGIFPNTFIDKMDRPVKNLMVEVNGELN